MKKVPNPENPDSYVRALEGWRYDLVVLLRKAVKANEPLDETIKWGHLVYLHNGPVLLIRAEKERVLFGFWRGKHLTEIEPRLKPSGKYEMATIEFREGTTIKASIARRLVAEAVVLNQKLGNPTNVTALAKRAKRPAKKRDHFYWGKELLACFEDLRTVFGDRNPAIVDREVIPNFDGRPDDLVIYFICKNAADVSKARRQLKNLHAAIQERMSHRGFPQSAIDSLFSEVTSLQDIEGGGGRFLYFR